MALSLKLKTLGLGILAITATAGLLGANAAATGGGHFVFDTAHTTVEGTQALFSEEFEFTNHGLEGGVICTGGYFEETNTSSTESELLMPPQYEFCHTTGSTTNIPIHENGCVYRLTVAAGTTDQKEQTFHLTCQTGKAIVITHPNCTISIPPQSVKTGTTYTRKEKFLRHLITVDTHAEMTMHYEAGICIFLGTNHTGTLNGSTEIAAYNTNGELVGITAT
jgi:hypothetical protein